MGMGRSQSVLHMVDLGLAKLFMDPKTHKHIPHSNIRRSLEGTARCDIVGFDTCSHVHKY